MMRRRSYRKATANRVALRPRLWPGVPLSWDVLGQRYATDEYTGRQGDCTYL
jgi:hypothetical protein